ncbi:HECT-domain-containing protein [Syncephalis plumigaleata]|nr:HECT-domain-containing protein [Syncephalis plumigaleata]
MTDPQQYKTIHQLRISSIRLIQQIHARDIILRQIPFLIPFADRVQLLQQLVYRSEERNRSLIRTLVPREISIRRSHVFEDAFNHIMSSERGEYSNFQVRFIDQFGMEESGFGGGIFKEFITILSNEAFNNEDLFSLTTDNRLYPRVDRFALQEQNLKKYEFLGIIVGLAIRDGILLDITMAGFFLNKWLGKISSLEDLASLDPDLYRGLVFLKGYDGNVEDLSLNFTIMDKEPDGLRERALVPNGANIPVNSDNRLNYVYLVANYRLNVQIERQSRAFLRGLSHLIELRWLRLFDTLELQGLIGGAYKPIDVEDLRHNTVYGGDYHDKHPIIQRFWRVVDSFDDEQRRKLLRFATSCSRPPLLGFADLRPKFAINPAENDQDRLPTTATCMNLLKLPPFKTYEIMKEKLLYAINTEAGFDLS